MKVVIPMAGYGTRLRPHTYSRPKPLITIAGQPMLKHLLDSLAVLDIDEYIFIVGYLGDQLEHYIRQTYRFKATFVQQKELSGQSPAIYLTREHLSGPTLLLFADTLFKADLSVIKNTTADAIAFVKEVDDPRRFGVVETDPDGRITRFIEKPESLDNRQVIIGLYYLRDASQMLRAIETQFEQQRMTRGEYYIADAFQIMIEQGANFRTHPVQTWLDTGKPETVLETNRYLLENGFDNSAQAVVPGVSIIPPVNIHTEARVARAVIGPHVTIAAGCEITDSIIRDSVIEEGAQVVSAQISGSLIGRGARVVGHTHTLIVGDHSTVDFR